MKIAIIGGGFYGAHIAKSISDKNSDIYIDIYEKEKDLFLGAFTNNQHRLHLGYHYPRSNETIDQSMINYYKFKELYADHIIFPNKNIYSIENTSKISSEDYKEIYRKKKLNFKDIDNNKLSSISKNISVKKIKESISVEEGTVNFISLSHYLSEYLHKNKKINIILNKNINNFTFNHDIVINATYNNPNLFLSNKIPLKHELCCILLAKNVMPSNIGVTIVDGDFCSIFPKTESIHSISSVLYTPFFKYKNEELFLSKKEIMDIYTQSDSSRKILEHSNDYIDITSDKIIGEMLSIKTKFDNDFGDTREALWVKENNYYSIFCGKISAVCSISEEIINDIGI